MVQPGASLLLVIAAPGSRLLVDHVGALVSDLERASDVLGRAGFLLTPPVPLMRTAPDGTSVPSGGRQRCVMLGQGYLELQALDTVATDHPLADRADRYAGFHVLAFSTRDAERTGRRWRARGLAVGPVQRWQRPAPASRGMADFTFVVVDPAATPEALVIATQQHTPSLIRPRGSTSHPNGARRIARTCIAARDADRAADRYRRLAGLPATPDGPGAYRIAGGRDELAVIDVRGRADRLAATPPAADSIAGVVLAVDDVARFAGCMADGGLEDLGEVAAIRWFRLPGTAVTLGARQA